MQRKVVGQESRTVGSNDIVRYSRAILLKYPIILQSRGVL